MYLNGIYGNKINKSHFKSRCTWSIFTKLTNAEQQYVHISYAKLPRANNECAKYAEKFRGMWWHSVTNRKDMGFIPDGHWNFSLT
jgi:hypothetical protein